MWPLPNWKLLASCVATASNRCASHPRPADCDLERAPPFCAMAPPLGSGKATRAAPLPSPLRGLGGPVTSDFPRLRETGLSQNGLSQNGYGQRQRERERERERTRVQGPPELPERRS
eukprot:16449999-Heterocapsa_arctica.AAC.1